MANNTCDIDNIADRLSRLYDAEFGGKERGRFRIATKLVRQIAGKRRLYEDDICLLGRAMLERGYVLIDMDTFFVILSANTFLNYRRVNESSIN